MPDGHAEAGPVARLRQRATALIAEGHAAEALPLLHRLRLLDLAPEVLEAQAMAALGRHGETIAACGRALAATPDDPLLLRLRARAWLAQGALDAAMDDAAAAVMAAPGDLAANATLGDALAESGRHADAVFLHRRVLAAAPDSLAAQLALGRSLMLAGEHAEAEAILAAAEQRAPSIAAVAAQRAQVQLLAGALDAAEAIARAALARDLTDAPVHNVLAHVLVAQGRVAEAAGHFRAASRLLPQDAYLAHLAAAAGGETTARAGDAYVTTLFDGYAPRFEASLLALGYRVPGLVRRAAEARFPQGIPGRVLDLGCGTGLAAVALLGLPHQGMVGVDLSANMLREAAGKGLYAALKQADIAAALREDATTYALIIAADVFCYLGDLAEVLALAARRLAPGGALLFSVERGAAAGWALAPSGRYRHARAYLEAALAAAGLRAEMAEEPLRREGEGVIEGFFVVATHA